jgi:hypothetical protein
MLVPILDIDRPLFHADIDEAYEAAVASLSIRQKTDNSVTTMP